MLFGFPGPVSHRQYLAWQHWLEAEWNRPSRLDHYLMLIACEVRRVLAKEPGRIQPQDFRLNFTFKKSGPLSKKAAAEKRRLEIAMAKARWGAFVGVAPPPNILGKPPEGFVQPTPPGPAGHIPGRPVGEYVDKDSPIQKKT